MSSIVVAGDTSGSITIAAPLVAGSNTITLPAATDTLVGKATTDTLTNKTLVDPTITGLQSLNTPNTFGFKNRIINGGMVIDQRNAGASVSATSGGQYFLDRYSVNISAGSKFTVARSSIAPTGFNSSSLITSSSAYSITSGDFFTYQQFIEGYNIADLGWGTASASTVTLSFWVRSSLTGTFGGTLANSISTASATRSYPFTYTISSANTWEQKTITIAGDTSGTWGATNAGGIAVLFGLGVGSTYSGTAGAWASADYRSSTGAVSVVGTSGATFYITGVQLEKGSTATSFDFRPYTTELQLCQRYLPAWQAGGNSNAQVPGSATALVTNVYMLFPFPVTARAAPTGITLSNVAHMSFGNNDGNAACTVSTGLAQSSSFAANFTFTVAVTRGATTTPGWLYANNTSLSFYFTGCEL